jgi:hypothetical protein
MANTFHRLAQNTVMGVLLCCLGGGCATWSEHGVILDSRKARIAVMPVQNTVTIKKLRDIESLPASTAVSTNEQETIDSKMREVTERIGQRIQEGLDRSYFFETVSREQLLLATKTNDSPLTYPLSADRVRQIGKALNADAILIVKVSGYGKIKRKWFYLLIGSGLTEGVVQGVIAAAVVDNAWVAVGVATEEILQEALTWGGGMYLFNRIFTPVILEAELVSTADGKIIWSDTAFARMNRKALKNLPKAEQGKKEVRLRLTAEKAIEDLLEALDKKAYKNIKYRNLGDDSTGEPRIGSGSD